MSSNEKLTEDSPILAAFMQWQNDQACLDRTDFTRFDVIEGMQKLALLCELPDWAFDVVMAVFLAASDAHPHFRIKVEKPTEQGFENIQRWNSYKISRAIADDIDCSIALGEKQEAAIQNAMVRYELSRREIFRRLKKIREERAYEFSLQVELPDQSGLIAVPEGFTIAPDGKLVSTNSFA